MLFQVALGATVKTVDAKTKTELLASLLTLAVVLHHPNAVLMAVPLLEACSWVLVW
jgi:hypothetical protein